MAKGDSNYDIHLKLKKPRRARGEGGLFQRADGTWIGRVIIGRDEKTGQPVRKEVSGKTKGIVKKKIDELREVYEGINYVDADKITVEQWLNKWLELYASPPQVQATTHEWYERIINLYLIPNLGQTKLCKLQGMAIQKMLVNMAKPPDESDATPADQESKAKKRSKKHEALTNTDKPDDSSSASPADQRRKQAKPRPAAKSARTIKAVYTILSMALSVAVKQGIIRRSPAETVTPPTVKPKEKQPLTIEQWDALLKAAQQKPDMFTAIVLEWATGMRRSELLALQWDDIDMAAGMITIKHSIKICNKEHGGLTVGSPKTQSSMRLLHLVPEAVIVLKSHKKEQAAMQLAAGERWVKTGFVFVTPIGKMWDPRDWSKEFKKIATAAGVDIGIHALRHDMSSRLASQNIPIKEAQYQMGHSTVTMLLDTYAHRMHGDQNKVAKAIRKNAPDILKQQT